MASIAPIAGISACLEAPGCMASRGANEFMDRATTCGNVAMYDAGAEDEHDSSDDISESELLAACHRLEKTMSSEPGALRPVEHQKMQPDAKRPRLQMNSRTNTNQSATTHCYRSATNDVSSEQDLRKVITKAADQFPCAGCVGKVPRRGWQEYDCATNPIGVYEFKGVSKNVSKRWHAIYALSRGEQLFAGCYGSKETAAQAWDSVARTAGCKCVNVPKHSGETRIAIHLRVKIVEANSVKFPHPPTNMDWRRRELHLVMSDVDAGASRIWRGDTQLQQEDHDTAAGNELCWSFHQHAVEVKKTVARGGSMVGIRPSAMDTFNDLTLRAKCVRSCVEYRGDFHVSRATLSGELRFLQGSWILNFQPRVAAAIYEKYAGVGSGAVVYDSSAGWGGRLLGALLAKNVERYIACEPSIKTFRGLQELKELVMREKPATLPKQFDIYQAGSENFELEAESLDMAFTSPPYFNLERYSDEPTQSHVKFPTFPSWCKGFLRPTLANTFSALKKGRFCLVNISNNNDLVSCGANLETATLRIAGELGAAHEATIRLLKGGGTAEIGEPVFVFRKLI